MKTNSIEKRVAMFNIGRGGRFNNGGNLTFEGFKRINECHDWSQNTFEINRDSKSKFCKKFLVDGSGNQLMNATEYMTALETGIGCLDFDGEYDTTYTTYTDELSNDELCAMSKNREYGVDEILKLYEYEPE